ncbi:MAG TPA: SAM-dependent methyltransferase [Opitutaceae bacterium]|nr:SAM-dependent methyltransferase [Opitutaceae bacterium]
MTITPQDEFAARLEESVRAGTFARLTLGKPRGGDPSLQKVLIRPVALKAGPHLSFVWRHDTKDLTKNLPPDEAVKEIARLVGTVFHSAHLATTQQSVQLEFNKKGEPRLSLGRSASPFPDTAHDRAKPRLLPAESQEWLQALGVTTASGAVREGMADKHRQIHKFVEILSHLVADATALPQDRPIEVADMGCGKGYLTFATHDWFDAVARRSARVCGVEARPDLVGLCNKIAHDSGRSKLSFIPGTIADANLPRTDILIALHACDTATDDALARGVADGAALLVAAPCCQKELRPQLAAPPVLAPALRHGIWQERHAEFATDALRALLLEWAGYETKAFEFISSEHTAKNLMLAAIRRPGPLASAPPLDTRTEDAARRVREFAAFYGVRRHALARHLRFAL